MTESDWLNCTDLSRMLEFVRGKVSDRKVRLFACVCCRSFLSFVANEHCRKAIKIAERFADGEVGGARLSAAWGSARRSFQTSRRSHRLEHTPQQEALWAIALTLEDNLVESVWLGTTIQAAFIRAREAGLVPGNGSDECRLLRDVVGNPIRAIWPLPQTILAWNYGTVPKVAQAIYDDRAFDRLPILADALEDAGCDNADILAHCRGGGEHVRGCWVVDLLLGKQ